MLERSFQAGLIIRRGSRAFPLGGGLRFCAEPVRVGVFWGGRWDCFLMFWGGGWSDTEKERRGGFQDGNPLGGGLLGLFF